MRYFYLPVLAALLLFSACANRVSLQEPSLSVASVANGPLPIEQIEACIESAAERMDWSLMDGEEPGHLIAERWLRTHYAMVDIRFDEVRVSIHYRDSEMLNYQEYGIEPFDSNHQPRSDPAIHPSYNSWVANLMDQIGRALDRTDAYCHLEA